MSAETAGDTRLPSNTRYHSLDALRAYAMLAGVALHLAIYFLPFHITGTRDEPSGTTWFTYCVYITHMYRMQVFFLLAGFFARLVLLRVGYRAFTWHRFQRIAIPFAAGWLIMYPLCTLFHVWGAIDSGSMLTDEPFWSQVFHCIINDELGGFSLVHLWFLYYLLLCYAIVVPAEWFVRVLLDRQERIRRVVHASFARLMTSRIYVVALSLPLWLLFYWIGDWFGIVTPADSLRPHVAVTITYTLFFLIGWLLHAQTHLLSRFERHWAFNLLGGVAISVPLFLYFEHGRSTGSITFAYPLIFDNDIRDYAAIRAAVRRTDHPEGMDTAVFFRNALPPLYRQLIEDTAAPSGGQTAGWTMEINKHLILNPTAFQPETDEDRQVLAYLQSEAMRRGNAPIPLDEATEGTPLQHRWLVEAAFPPGTFATNLTTTPYYRPVFALFSAAYAVGTWLLVFGSIGFFLRFFANPNWLVRYFADASYWLYLVHFPLLWQINLLMADVPWHWLPKSLFYAFVAFVIMMPSYHYLVRSTWMGQLLNGRKYPLQPWFRRFVRRGETDETASPGPAIATDG